MTVHIRNLCPEDHAEACALNDLGMPQVNNLPLEKVEWLVETGSYFRLAEIDGRLAGMLVGIGCRSGYHSVYYDWFHERYEDFLYLDRVIVAPWARRQGVAWALFADIERWAAGVWSLLASEVYSKPPNQPSLNFHRRFGFEQVAVQAVENGSREVAKFIKYL